MLFLSSFQIKPRTDVTDFDLLEGFHEVPNIGSFNCSLEKREAHLADLPGPLCWQVACFFFFLVSQGVSDCFDTNGKELYIIFW